MSPAGSKSELKPCREHVENTCPQSTPLSSLKRVLPLGLTNFYQEMFFLVDKYKYVYLTLKFSALEAKNT